MRYGTRLVLLSTLSVGAVALALLLSGCATLFSGSTQDVSINSEPTNADIIVDGNKRGKTPATIEINRPEKGDPPEIILRKEGYPERKLTPTKNFNNVTLLNVLNPFNYVGVPVLGFGIDWFSGALWKYRPKTYTVELQRDKASAGRVPPPFQTKDYTLITLPKNADSQHDGTVEKNRVVVLETTTGTVFTAK